MLGHPGVFCLPVNTFRFPRHTTFSFLSLFLSFYFLSQSRSRRFLLLLPCSPLVASLTAAFVRASLDENESLSYLRTARFFDLLATLWSRAVALVVGTSPIIAAFRVASDPLSGSAADCFCSRPFFLLSLSRKRTPRLASMRPSLVYSASKRTSDWSFCLPQPVSSS